MIKRNVTKHVGVGGVLKYLFARLLRLFSLKWPLIKHTWTFSLDGVKIKARVFESDIFLIRALLIGEKWDGNGEYDFQLVFPHPVKNIIDAGANIGLFSVIAAIRFQDARIISVEPEIGNYKMCVHNTSSLDNVTCLQEGLWNDDTYLRLIDNNRGTLGYRFEQTNEKSQYHAVSVNTIAKKYGMEHIDILKMDIEGSEFYVFDNNLEWIDKTRVLIIETHDKFITGTSKKIESIMHDKGFRKFHYGENDIYCQSGIECLIK